LKVVRVDVRDHRPALVFLERLERDAYFLEHLPAAVLEIAHVDRVVHMTKSVQLIGANFNRAAVRFGHGLSDACRILLISIKLAAIAIGSCIASSNSGGFGIAAKWFVRLSCQSGVVRGMRGISLRNKYDFRWEVLDVIISGKSSIDSTTGFQIQNMD